MRRIGPVLLLLSLVTLGCGPIWLAAIAGGAVAGFAGGGGHGGGNGGEGAPGPPVPGPPTPEPEPSPPPPPPAPPPAPSAWAIALTPAESVTDVVAHPQEPSVVFALTPGAIYKSTDAGNSWTKGATTLAPPGGALASIAVTGSSVYVGIADGPSALDGNVAVSTDDGASFAIVATESVVFTRLATSPIASQTVYAISFPTATANASVFRSEDSGATFTISLTAAGSTQFLDLAVAPSDSSTVVCGLGSQQGSMVTHDGGLSWSGGFFGLSCSVESVAIDPVTSSTLYAGLTVGEGIYASADGGATWSPTGNGFPGSFNATRLRVAPAASTTIYAATDGVGAFVSLDGSETFVPANFGISLLSLTSVAVDSANPLLAYATEAVHVYVTTTGGR
jgi:photosystem II stability/assembly factor-like uncharacterized protein